MSHHAQQKPSIVAFPSVSSSLHTLPQATSIAHVALHSNMYAPHAAESEAKLQKALSRSASSTATLTAYRGPSALPQPSSGQDPAQLTIRTKSAKYA